MADMIRTGWVQNCKKKSPPDFSASDDPDKRIAQLKKR
jgi:hypothetical protein